MPIKKISNIFVGHERSIKAKKNILAMLLIRGGNILIGFLLVPMTINYVDSERYGIWLALSSMIAWMQFFDIGINNGLKNRLTQAIAKDDQLMARKYVSTTYAILTMIFLPLMLVSLILAPVVDWNKLLNITSNGESLIIPVAIIVTYFCINFILSTINIVLIADQRPADSSFRQFVQQLLTLTIIYVLTLTTKGSLTNLCLGLCASPLIVILIFNFTLFRGRYKNLAPSIRFVDFKIAPDLMKLGVQFFIIQIAGVIQYQMINFLIIRYYGAEEVTDYNIANKYFNVLAMIWGILTTPIWAAVTDAVARDDFQWIRDTMRKYQKVLLLFVLVGFGMLVVSPWIYDIWVGDAVKISFTLSLWVLLYNFALMLGTIYVLILNGSGQLKIQTYASMISPAIFLISFALLKYNGVGVYSILISAIIANFNGLILAPYECYSYLKKH